MAVEIIVDPNFVPTWRENVPPEVYHADKNAVNSSSAKWALKSGADFLWHFENDVEETKSMRMGTLAHMAILEGQRFIDSYIVMPEITGLTQDGKVSLQSKAAKQARAEWVEAHKHKTIVTQEEYDTLRWQTDSVIANDDALKILTNGTPELTGYYADPVTGILNRFRLDFLPRDVSGWADVKTVAVCDVDWFRSNRVEDNFYQYDFQAGSYDFGTETILGRRADIPVWILIASQPPWRTIVVPIEDVYLEIGRKKHRKAQDKIKSCIDLKRWDPPPTVQSMHPNHWYLQKQQEE